MICPIACMFIIFIKSPNVDTIKNQKKNIDFFFFFTFEFKIIFISPFFFFFKFKKSLFFLNSFLSFPKSKKKKYTTYLPIELTFEIFQRYYETLTLHMK